MTAPGQHDRPRASHVTCRGGEQAAPRLFRRCRSFGAALVLLLCLPLSLWSARPELVFTELFAAAGSDIDALLLDDKGQDVLQHAERRLRERLDEHYHLLPFSMENPAASLASSPAWGSRVFVRALVSSADIKEQAWFGDYRVFTWRVALRLECFDIRSGQVYYGNRFSVHLPQEGSRWPEADSSRARFGEALDRAVDLAVQRLAQTYQPESLDLVCTAQDERGRIYLDRGAAHGIVPGMIAELDQDVPGTLARISRVEERWCQAELPGEAPGLSPPFQLKVGGINSRLNGSGAQLAVSGTSLPAAERRDGAFLTDAATMGQWLHDALVDQRRFRMLPPLLTDDGGEGRTELAVAFYRAQAAFSSFGDTGQQDIIGHRVLPEALARLSVTHATRTVGRRLGFEAHTLRMGLLLEIVDRESGEVLLSQGHEAVHMEKHNDVYRKIDLEAAWRELALTAISGLVSHAAPHWISGTRSATLVKQEGEAWICEPLECSAGERGRLQRLEARVLDRDGAAIGNRWRDLGLFIVEDPERPRMIPGVLLGGAQPRKGDRVLMAGRPARPLARLESIRIEGSKVRADYQPDELRLLLLAHQALAASGRFVMLPPEQLESRRAAEQVALASGEFESVELEDIFRQQPPQPDVQVDLRLGLARWSIEEGTYRREITFTTGVELSFSDRNGQPLALAKARDGSASSSIKKAWNLKRSQELSNGAVVQGVLEEEFPDLLDECLAECIGQLSTELRKDEPE